MAMKNGSQIERKKQVVDRKTLAIAFGVSEPTVLARVREGMPVIRRGSKGKPWQFDLAECVNWDKERAVRKAAGVVKGDETDAELNRRLLQARVKREEIEAAKVAAEVVPVEEVESAVVSAFTEVRQAMLSIPDRAALRLLAADDETEIKEILRDEIDLALHSLADADLLEEFDNDSDD